MPVYVAAVRGCSSLRPRRSSETLVPDRGRRAPSYAATVDRQPRPDRDGRAAVRPARASAATSPGRSAASAPRSSALMSMFIVGRHTRAEEQSGRSELVGAAPVGRYAPLAAALVVVGGRAACCSALRRRARDDRRWTSRRAGSLALGASLAGVGLVFAGVAAVAAQVSREHARRCTGIAGAALGARLPAARGRRRRRRHAVVAVADRLGPGDAAVRGRALVAAGAVARRRRPCSSRGAVALRARRDEGAGLVAPRPGPADREPRADAARSGSRCGSSAARCIGWSAGLFLSGVSIGLTGRDAESLRRRQRRDRGASSARGRGDLVDQYFAVSMLTMALIGAGFGIQAALRMRGEETRGRLEPLLATALSRRALGRRLRRGRDGRLVRRAGAPTGSAPGSPTRSTADDAGQLPRLLARRRSCPRPRCGCVVGATVALFGLVPRAAAAAWGVLGACVAARRCSARCSACPTGCSTSRRSSTSRSCRPPTSAPAPLLALCSGGRGADRGRAGSALPAARPRSLGRGVKSTAGLPRRTRRPRCR